MSTESGRNDPPPDKKPPPGPGDCTLTDQQQLRNVVLYSINWCLIYLASPVVYVGLVHAALSKQLGANDTISNLPAGVYLWTSPLPVLVVWFFPQVRLIRRLIFAGYLTIALMGWVVAAVLMLPPDLVDPAIIVIPALIAHAAVLGCANGVMATCQWEVLGRGVSEARRGLALALAFGVGPMLAVVASVGSQLLLAGKMELPGFRLAVPRLESPQNFVILFASSVPIMGLAACLSLFYVVPTPTVEVSRQPFLEGVFGGFGEFLSYRLILIAAIAYILVYSGHMVMPNINLYTEEVVGETPADLAGTQLTLRFGFKVVAGFLLGWLLIRTHPKASLLVTASLTLAGVVWALFAPGMWFLLSFGILGAGELFGVYYPNYILSCSNKSRMRRNMAFTSLITMPVGFASILFGGISDTVGEFSTKKFGFQMSFLASIAMLVITLVLVQIGLPARPRPQQSDMDKSDEIMASTP
jgi:hypothetical protein